ncbi:hypothetical protein F8388_024432 [Cannabis sativa]|uniref:Uncharacterized protein n=1 Tax=Cannabis sativa TaxID=3483 RepID=A0A7J6EHH7_CANSA|nr:hypothetical protein F8388_024432 [Cannabis sativa]
MGSWIRAGVVQRAPHNIMIGKEQYPNQTITILRLIKPAFPRKTQEYFPPSYSLQALKEQY